MGIADVFRRRSDGSSEGPTPVPPPMRPSISEQLTTLSRLGVEPGHGVDAKVIAQDREAAAWVKRHPYAALLHCLSRDRDGKLTHHPRVVSVDLEHVVGPDSYPNLLRRLAEGAGTSHLLQEVSGDLDRERGRWVVRFTFDGLTEQIHPRLDHDRADPVVLPVLYGAVAGKGQRPAHVRHGQMVTVVYAATRHAAELQRVLDRWATP